MTHTLDTKLIDTLRDLPDMIPVFREFYESWSVRVFNRKQHDCRNYLSPNRREFYKILLITEGTGVFTIGLNTYNILEPTIVFLHPNDIISWRNLSEEVGGYYILFRKSFTASYPQIRSTIEKYGLFNDKSKSVIKVEGKEIVILGELFGSMLDSEISDGSYKEDAIQAYLQLMMIECMKIGRYPKPGEVTGDYRHIHHFFDLLEKEVSAVNIDTPIRIKTAKEFASDLAVHPNYLNELLKKHTGQNASTHIRSRLLDETKALLLQTQWSIQDLAFSIGFTEQSNFNLFFKKNTGFTPAEFRRKFQVQL